MPMTARAWAGFATMSVLWGIPYLFIKVAVDDGLSPAFVAWSRVVLAAAVLLVLAHRAGALGTLRGKGRWLAAYAFLEITIPFPLIAAGEQHVDSSLAAIIIASVPLLVAVLALRFDRAERATGSRLVGLLVGFTGVVVLVGIDVAGRRRRAARRGLHPDRLARLRRRADGAAPPPLRARPARGDGRLARDRGRVPDAGHARRAARPRRRRPTRC